MPPRNSGGVAVELVSLSRRRSWGWWCVLLPAMLAVAVYLLFQVLDVTGSKLPSRLADEAVAAIQSSSLDAERPFHVGHSGAPLASAIPSGPTSLSAVTVLGTVGACRAAANSFRHRCALVRPRVGTQARPATSPTADPL